MLFGGGWGGSNQSAEEIYHKGKSFYISDFQTKEENFAETSS